MKYIRQLTNKEREAKTSFKWIKLKEDSPHTYYFACDKCGIAYFAEDIVGVKMTHDGKREYIVCPNMIKKPFRKPKLCLNHMYGGSEECLKEYYKII